MTKKQRVRVGGHVLQVLWAGKATGRCVVLVHGNGTSHRYFLPLVRKLAPHFRVAAIDLPGFGASAGLRRPLTIPELAEVLHDFIESQQLDDPILVGHSMGCQVIAHVLSRYSTSSAKAIFIAPTTSPHRRRVGAHAAALMADVAREPLPATLQMCVDYVRCGARRYLRTLTSMLHDQIEQQLAQSNARVLVIRGQADPIVPAGWAKQVACVAGGSYHEVAGAAHLVHYSRPAEVARATLRFAAD